MSRETIQAYFIGGPLDLSKQVIAYPPPRTIPFYKPYAFIADYTHKGETVTPCERLFYLAGPTLAMGGIDEKAICYLYSGKDILR